MRVLIGLGLFVVACSSSVANTELSAGDEAGAGGQSEPTSSSADSGAGAAPSLAGASSAGEPATPDAGAGGGEVMPKPLPPGGEAAGGQGGGGGAVPGGGGSASTGGQGGAASSCTPKLWYADSDRDGFGNAKQSQKACEVPQGYVADATDCYDSNAKAHPGQAEWFPTNRGDGSFDYDCSGSEELRYPIFSPCPEFDNSCPPPNRWPEGFTCDYLGMTAPYSQPEDGWRLYRYSICIPEPCTTAVVKLPACGEVGRHGKPPIGWDVAKSEYTCEAMPALSDTDINRLGKRTQACH